MAKLEKIERNLYLDGESGVYVWRESVEGRPYWRSTGEKTLSAARTKIKHFRMQVLGKEDPQRRRKDFKSLFETLLKIQASKSKNTLVMAETQVNNHLAPWFQKKCPYINNFEKQYSKYWSQYISDQKGLTPGRKLEHDRRHLLMALRLGKNMGWLRKEFQKVDLPLKEFSTPIGKALTKEEWEQLDKAVTSFGGAIRLQTYLGYFMGMRLREILHLQTSEVDLKSKTIVIRPERIKTRQPRAIPVPIHEKVEPLLKSAVLASRGKFIFPARMSNKPGAPVDLTQPQDSNRKPWRRALALAGVSCRFHDLRHTAISNMLAAGIPPLSVSQATGASIRVINKIYNHISQEIIAKIRSY